MCLTSIFYYIDEYCKHFNAATKSKAIKYKLQKRSRAASLFAREIITILVYYHISGFKTFKHFYLLSPELKSAFPTMPSYNRFIELQERVVLELGLLVKIFGSHASDGITYIDSFPLKVCHPKRIHSHKVFKGIAARGKTSVGWFFGLKLHLVVTSEGEVIDFLLTPGNIADNNANVLTSLLSSVQGKVYGDKGYIVNKELFQMLYSQGAHLITKLRKNMRNTFMDLTDKLLLAKRGMIESIGSLLKTACNIEHSRYRSPKTLLLNVFSGIMAYVFRPNKPSIRKKMVIAA